MAVQRTWPDLLADLVRGTDLSRETAAWAMEQMLNGAATPVQLGAFLVALRAKGETVPELSGLSEVMTSFATAISVDGPSVDVVGSGGDRLNTVNISTMAAIVAAGAGARVVKHGNRAASSTCGAADVLEELGVVLDLSPQAQSRVISDVGIGFLFAPYYHPGLGAFRAPRRELGIATVFNFLGPLVNPARPVAQSVGVADPRMAALMAGVFADRGNQGLVAHGLDGLDELTTTTKSTVWIYADGAVTETELDPRDLGIERADVADLTGGDAGHNAGVVRSMLSGQTGPVRDIVLLNAAAALLAEAKPSPSDLGGQLGSQWDRAAEAVDSGAARTKLEHWVEATRTAARG